MSNTVDIMVRDNKLIPRRGLQPQQILPLPGEFNAHITEEAWAKWEDIADEVAKVTHDTFGVLLPINDEPIIEYHKIRKAG